MLSLTFLCSIGLTSCWSKREKVPQHTDFQAGDIIDVESLEKEVISLGGTLRIQPLTLGRVYYFDEIIKRHTHLDEAFSEIIDRSFYPNVIIDFYADWCGPCKALGNLLHDISAKNRSVLIVKVNIEHFPTIAQQFDVRTLPTLLFFKNGSLVKRIKGFNKKELLRTINDIF